jgi:hypothetical protein
MRIFVKNPKLLQRFAAFANYRWTSPPVLPGWSKIILGGTGKLKNTVPTT